MNELAGLSLDTGTWILLLASIALVLVFEFINGFHDTANAVATVIYTQTLKPVLAVIWSGLWNFLGAVFSSGAVALSIITLVHGGLLTSPDSSVGMATVFAIPLAAIAWNFGTWYLGLPASSSHTLIGSILGVGCMHAFMAGGEFGAGVNWKKAMDVGLSLLVSPAVGFICAALLLLLAKVFLKNPDLYRAPDEGKKPPLWIRGILVLTCTGVSFAHGSNDGQKGMGLFMLVLIVMLPGLYSYHAGDPLVIPLWVKLAVALALGCGTMIGWKRIVVTVGEKIGKSHMTYAQGASAEIVAMGTIEVASALGMPVSTTHVLSSGVAGTMFANKSGLQHKTVASILLAWILTLPASVFLGSAFFGAGTFVILQMLNK
jgi:phosphate/sulfate permease